MRTPSDELESDQEQLTRQLSELLQELRVAMPGVQVLFGFLLAVPFNQRFAQVIASARLTRPASAIRVAVRISCGLSRWRNMMR